MQSLVPVWGLDVAALHAGLLDRRVLTVLHGDATAANLSFILTATQTATCIDRAVDALAQTVRKLLGRDGARGPLLEAP